MDSSLSTCTKAGLSQQNDRQSYLRFSHRIFSSLREFLKDDTDMVASYYRVVPYLQHSYASLATANLNRALPVQCTANPSATYC